MYGQPQIFDMTKQPNQLPSPRGFDLAQLLAQANAQYQRPMTPDGQMVTVNGRQAVAPVGWNGQRPTQHASSRQQQYRGAGMQSPSNWQSSAWNQYDPNQRRTVAGTSGTFTPDYQAMIRGVQPGYQDAMRQQAQAIERARILQQQQPNDEIARVMQLNRYL